MNAAAIEVTLTGTGYPRPDPKRAGPGCLVVAGGKRLQFDCGRDTVRRLATLGIAPAQLDALFFTHYHSDHLTDLADMAMTRWWFGRNKPPLAFKGPTGLNKRLSDVEEFLRHDAKRRAEHGSREDAFVVRGDEFERPRPGQTPCVYEHDGVRVLTAAVEHGNVEEAVGYRVEHDGRAVAISGDCSYSPGLVELARGADLLVHEIISPKLLGDRIGPAALPIIEYHSTGEEVARVANEAGVAHVVLTHLVPGPSNAEEETHFIDAVAHDYDGKVTLGEDLMQFSLTREA
jgi:ribonuclease Z